MYASDHKLKNSVSRKGKFNLVLLRQKMGLYVHSTSGPPPSVVPEITRKSASFHPSVWGDKFLVYYSTVVGIYVTLIKLHILTKCTNKLNCVNIVEK